MKTLTMILTSAIATAAAGLAQNPEDAAVQTGDATRAAPPLVLPGAAVARPEREFAAPPAANPDLFRAPIRAGVDDNGYRYGTWATGADYKVSFDRGMEFYPVLGTRYPHNLPVGWTTTEVEFAGRSLMADGESPTEGHDDWRYEYRFTAFTESADVLQGGVEQRFVVHRRPAGAGDLTVRGRITTELEAQPRGFAHAPIVFRHRDGTDVVRYGEAFALDATGRKIPMETAFDGREIALRVAAKTVAEASFPLTIDPLLSSVVVATGANGSAAASHPDIARDDDSNRLIVSYGRYSSASDYDGWVRMTDDSFGSSTVVYNDVTSSWSTRYMDCAFVGGPRRFIVVLQRDFPSTTGSWIRYHAHDSGDTTLSTAYRTLAGSTGNSLTLPEVGGTAAFSSGDNAFVVYQSDVGLGNSSSSRVIGHLIDVRNETNGPAIDLEPGASFDRESPSINQTSSGGNASWIVCWTQLDNSIANDDWDLIIERIDATGTSQGRSFLGDPASSVHAFLPKVAGSDGRYMVCYGEDGNGAGTQPNGWAPSIRAHRFDWSESSSAPTRLDLRTVRASRSAQFWNGDIAYDNNTDSHWGIVFHSNDWNVYGARVGFDARICESATIYNTADNGYSPGITFDDDANRFAVVFAAQETTQPLYGVIFDYPTFSQPVSYGVGCGSAVLGSNSNGHSRKPHSGAEFFELRMTSTPTNALGALNIGLAPHGAPIPFLPGCFQNVDLIVTSLPASATGTTARVALPIPGGITGDLFFQHIYVDPGYANPIPVRTSNGLQVFIR